jgi:hypothetical protein
MPRRILPMAVPIEEIRDVIEHSAADAMMAIKSD